MALTFDHALEILPDLVQRFAERRQPLALFIVNRNLDGMQIAQCAALGIFEFNDGFVARTRCEIAGADAHAADVFLEIAAGIGDGGGHLETVERRLDIPFAASEEKAIGDKACDGNQGNGNDAIAD
ncbi:MAG: hypothetical protein RO009_06410 [Pseudorhodoplanes sp.]|nr:hypothetical protein [Pseudorhodoplanes sp.]